MFLFFFFSNECAEFADCYCIRKLTDYRTEGSEYIVSLSCFVFRVVSKLPFSEFMAMAFLLTFLVIFMISDTVVFCTHKKYSLPEEEKIMAFEAITMDRKLLAIGDRLLEKIMTLTSQ